MRRTPFILICLTLSVYLAACQDTSPTDEANDTGDAAASAASYPSIPVDSVVKLLENTDAIDFVFYEQDFSMNQTEPSSIRTTISHIATEAPDINPNCQAVGSLFFFSQGKQLAQAELYFRPECLYYVWLFDGKRRFANKMTANGLQFYQRVFAQTQQLGQ